MEKKKFPLFYKVYFVVLALAIVAAAVFLWWLNGFLADYEASQPKHVADEVFEKYYKSGDFESLAKKCVDTGSFEGADAVAAYLHGEYDGKDMTCTTGASKDGTPTYIVKVGDEKISTFTLRESEKKTSRGWETYEEGDFVLYYGTKSASVIAPEGYTVSVNGIALADANVTEKDIPGEGDNLLPDGVKGIKYVRYEAKGIINDPAVTAKTAEGGDAEVVFDEAKGEWKAQLKFDSELEKAQTDFVVEAAEAYSKYMSNDAWWGGIKGYFDPESEIYENASTSLTGFVIDHDSVRFDDVKASEFYSYSKDVFSCRVAFTQVLVQGVNEFKDYVDQTIFFRLVNDEWVICGMINNA